MADDKELRDTPLDSDFANDAAESASPRAVPRGAQDTELDDQGEEIRTTDILFDCPHCGKSLVIDYRGAGLITQCTECAESITVPIPEGMELSDLDQTPEEKQIQIIHLRRALEQADTRIMELESIVAGLKERRNVLERARAETLHRFAEIRSACEHVQRSQVEMSSAVSRIIDVISRE